MELIEYQGIAKYEKSPTITMYEKWTYDTDGNVVRHTSFDLKTWKLELTPYKKIPVFIVKHHC